MCRYQPPTAAPEISEMHMGDRLPSLYSPGDDEPVRQGTSAARRYSGSPPETADTRPAEQVAVYGVKDLQYQDIPDRDQCWGMLGKAVQERIVSRAGKVLDWWALPGAQGRMRAVVLGTESLVTAEPTTNGAGKPAHRIHPLQLDRGSFRFIEVTGTAQKAGGEGGGGGGGIRKSSGDLERYTDLGLDSEMIDFLGNLPTRAQILLQSPFARHAANIDYQRYFYRTGTSPSDSLFIGCYLTDGNVLTFASGTRYNQRGRPEWQSSWHLICRQAAASGQRWA